MKLRSVALAVSVLLVPLAGCGERENLKDEVLAAIAATREGSYRLQYEETRPNITEDGPDGEQKVAVAGLVEDDFRFKARVDFNGQDGFDEVVADDTLAMRFIDPSRVNPLVNKEKVAEENKPTELKVSSLEVLQSRRWVVDSSGAPAVSAVAAGEGGLGKDPVLDAITVLAYVERALVTAVAVERFDVEDITPVYSSSEDTFPKPERGSGVTRYDLRRPKLPPPSQQANAADGTGRPQTQHFRRMAIYVKDGKVVQVREATDIRGKAVNDTLKYFRTALRESKAPAQVRKVFDDAVNSAPEAQRGLALQLIMNGFLQTIGEDPILMRTMNLELRDHGADIKVDLPTEDVVAGSLGFLVVSERGKVTDESAGSTGAGGGRAGGGATSPGTTGGAPSGGTPSTTAPGG